MAWEKTEWACGHTGSMQLYGKLSGRDATVATQAGRKCMACWLVEQWEQSNDPRAQRMDRYKLAGDIAEAKGKRIYGLSDNVPAKSASPVVINPLAQYTDDELLAEVKRRGL